MTISLWIFENSHIIIFLIIIMFFRYFGYFHSMVEFLMEVKFDLSLNASFEFFILRSCFNSFRLKNPVGQNKALIKFWSVQFLWGLTHFWSFYFARWLFCLISHQMGWNVDNDNAHTFTLKYRLNARKKKEIYSHFHTKVLL